MSRTHQERRRAMFGRVGRGFFRNAHAPMTTPTFHGPAFSDPLPEIPESIRSALALVTDAANRCAWKQLMERCRILSDAAMIQWLRVDREATEAAAKINPPEIR